MANVAPPGLNQFFDSNGDPLASGKLFTYDAGTTTPRTTWSDAAETTPNANPVILDSAGRAQIFYRGDYKLVLKTSADVTIWTVDGFEVPDVSGSNAAIQWKVDGSNVGSAGQFDNIDLIDGLTGTAASDTLTVGLDGMSADANRAWTIAAPASGTTLTLNGVTAIVLQVNGGSGIAANLTTNSDAATHYSAFNNRQNNVSASYFGADGSNALCGDSADGDTIIRADGGGSIRFTIAGTSTGWRIDTSSRLLNPARTQTAFRGYSSAARTTAGVYVTYTQEYDQGAAFDPSTGVFTAPVAGLYLISFTCSVSIGSGSGGYGNFGIRKNGTSVNGGQATAKTESNTLQQSVSSTIPLVLAASDTIDVELLAVAGTSASTLVNTFSAVLLG